MDSDNFFGITKKKRYTHLMLGHQISFRKLSTVEPHLFEPRLSSCPDYLDIASYPGHMGGGKSGLVSTVCACANDSGNLLQTSPIMDKLHVVVMRRNNQTRYTACSVAAVFTRRYLPLIRDTRGDTTRTTLQPPPVPPSLCL